MMHCKDPSCPCAGKGFLVAAGSVREIKGTAGIVPNKPSAVDIVRALAASGVCRCEGSCGCLVGQARKWREAEEASRALEEIPEVECNCDCTMGHYASCAKSIVSRRLQVAAAALNPGGKYDAMGLIWSLYRIARLTEGDEAQVLAEKDGRTLRVSRTWARSLLREEVPLRLRAERGEFEVKPPAAPISVTRIGEQITVIADPRVHCPKEIGDAVAAYDREQEARPIDGASRLRAENLSAEHVCDDMACDCCG